MAWLIILVLILLIPILSIVLDSQVGRALAGRLERREIGEGGALLAERIRHLEGEVDRLSSEVSRLEEEGQFLHRLLTERGGEPGPAVLPEGDHDA